MSIGHAVELIVAIKGDNTNLKSELDESGKQVSKFGADVKDSSTKIGAIVEIGKKATRATIDMAKAGKDASAAEAEFANSLANLGAAQEGWQTKTDAAILSAQKLGQSDDAARAAITTLVGATGDLDTALGMLPGVMDVAAKGSTDMATAADAVAKAYGGNDLALKRMVDDYSELEEGQSRIDKAFATNATAAENWAASAEGTAARADVAMSEAGESIGTVLVQAFGAIKEALQPVMDALKPFVDALRDLLTAIMPFLNPLLDAMAKMLNRVADKLARVMSFATRILEFFTKLIEKISEVAQKIGDLMPDFDKLKDFDFTPGDRIGNHGSAAGGMSAGTTAGGSARSSGGVIINIYGDPSVIEAKVAAAIRNYNRRNGPGAILAPGRT